MRRTGAVVAPALALVLWGGSATASGIPTVDVVNIAQTTLTASNSTEQLFTTVEQLQKLKEQYETIKKQYEQQLEEWDGWTGARNLNSLLNGWEERGERRYTPESWEETLAILQEGKNPGGATDELERIVKEVRDEDQRYSREELFGGDGEIPESLKDEAEDYERSGNRLYTHRGVSQVSFNKTNERLLKMESLITEINNARDPKAALDMQSRLVGQLGILLTEMIRMQATNNMITADRASVERNTYAADRKARTAYVRDIPSIYEGDSR
ncbi:type IV secretion system protein [Arhodomonas sp. AD133]|uniref:type IV secretion system protein n=1 Tax=Arhodomonas sp. AD133 TaxID=3415009 RepID=UPI003EB80BAE